jgi:rare lipoprotein A
VLTPTALRMSAMVLPLVGAPVFAHAETMVTSYYRAKTAHHAAHRTLPMGTALIVTNPRNGRSARVIIRTRGPYVRGRSLDISHAAAKQLGFQGRGVVRLSARVVKDEQRP